MKQTPPSSYGPLWQQALRKGLIDDADTTLIFLDMSILRDRVQRLIEHFPEGALHAIAVKTNPLAPVLQALAGWGVGLEAASLAEAVMAARATGEPERVVFDSPAKTRADIDYLATHHPGCYINADSLEELALYPKEGAPFSLGLRINPTIQTDSLGYLSVSGHTSKFGVPIAKKEAIFQAVEQWQELRGLHLHIGSSFQDLEPSVRAISAVMALADEINERLGTKKIDTIDIGGGFPVNYREGEPYRVERYAERLREACPALWEGRFKVITEFGRYVHANAAWCATRVEYVKPFEGGANLIVHAGADMFLRECYNPGDWFHHMTLIDAEGRTIDAKAKAPYNIAGPLCFGGDFIDKGRNLPQAKPGDRLVIADVGANTFSLWSKHCSRAFPKVLGYNEPCGEDLSILKKRESLEDLIAFWH